MVSFLFQIAPLLLLLAGSCHAKYEPAFPTLFSSSRAEPEAHQIHLVSELTSEWTGYLINEEYVDFSRGKDTCIVSDKEGIHVTHTDSQLGLSYKYRPYLCQVVKINQEDLMKEKSLWYAVVRVMDTESNHEQLMQLYGLLAVWLNFEKSKKIYSRSEVVYSASKNVYKQAHKWSKLDQKSNQMIHLYFMGEGKNMTLEMAKVTSPDGKTLIETINVLSLDYSIPEDAYNDMMSVPLGYGCLNEARHNIIKSRFLAANSLWTNVLKRHTYRLELELTAGKVGVDSIKSTKSSWNVELIRSEFMVAGKRRNLMLVRRRNSHSDTKRIWDFFARVGYTIDERKNTCLMSNLGQEDETSGESFSLEFDLTGGGGMKLELNRDKIRELLVDWEGFFFIKTQKARKADSSQIYVYAEKTSRSFFRGRTARLVRTYADKDHSNRLLRSVTIWLMSEDGRQIDEIFHLNVVSASSPDSFLELSKAFDLSEECYLTNEAMQAGKDYAWLEVFYPMEGRQLQLLARKPDQIRQELYGKLAEDNSFNLMRLPRVELMFEQGGLVARMLLLDAPPLPLLYELHPNQTLVLVLANSQLSQSQLAVDLDHCAELCRQSRCNSMSFCEQEHTCLLSQLVPGEPESVLAQLEAKPNCNAYTLPKNQTAETLDKVRLAAMLSRLRHQDYSPTGLPKVPEELLFPREQSGLDEQSYKSLSYDYRRRFLEALKVEGDRLPLLTLSMILVNRMIFLVPNELKIEQDPLNELGDTLDLQLDSLGFEEQDKVSAGSKFHQGLNLLRFLKSDKSRQFNGLTYDQCATACIETSCSSFSYCIHRMECVTTDIYNIGPVVDNSSLVESDADCLIAQRDFLSKFHRFSGIQRRPGKFQKLVERVQNAAECAHSCAAELGFNCLAFDFCAKNRAQPETGCYLLEQRLADDWRSANDQNEDAGCVHFSRSFLADFNQLNYRRIVAGELAKLKTDNLPGLQVDACAEACVNQVPDCSAFQLCFQAQHPEMTNCTVLSSNGTAPEPDTRVVLEPKQGGRLVSVGKVFEQSDYCSVFILRRDASDEAGTRPPVFQSETPDEQSAASQTKPDSKLSSWLLTIVGAVGLYLAVATLVALVVLLLTGRSQRFIPLRSWQARGLWRFEL